MKKLILTAFAALAAASLSAQVLPSAGIQNTLYTGAGTPLEGDLHYYGVLDTVQARADFGSFTVEGMLNWGAIANLDGDGDVDNFTILNTNRNPLQFKYGNSRDTLGMLPIFDNSANTWYTTLTDNYYVNFFYHFSKVKGLDLGLGTKLNWSVGTAPRYGAWLWEPDAHVRQGGFSTMYDDRHGAYAIDDSTYHYAVDIPGTADVVGFAPFANKYGKKGLGVRYVMDKNFHLQVGAVIPQGFNTDHPVLHAGAEFGFDWLMFSAAFEGIFQKGSNIYTGATLNFKRFVLDLYAGIDGFRASDITDDTYNEKIDATAYPTGAAMTIWLMDNFCLRPEAGLNFFEESNFTFAFHSGCQLTWILSKTFTFKAWGSFAIGSKDKRWDDKDSTYYSETKDWDGGHIINLRPEVQFQFDNRNTISGYVDFEQRKAFDGKSRTCWATGAYWTHKIGK